MSSTQPAPSREPAARGGAGAPVVVGFDGSREGRDALELARVLCEVRGARCIVASLIEWGPVSVRRAIGEAEEGEAEPLLREAQRALTGLELETRVVGRRAAGRKLAEFAAREGASTLVAGAPQRRSGAGRVLLGSFTEQLLQHATCEVAIAPRGYGDASRVHLGLGRVVVAFDGGEDSRRALRHAEELAEAAAAPIQILVVFDQLAPGAEAEAPFDGPAGEGVLDAAVNSVRDSLQVSGKVLGPARREAAEEVAEALAAACGDDILVCGCGPPSDGTLLAAVTKRLIEMSVLPVLVVPAPSRW